ncbi:MAG: efflux transporter periplasmic adaptor subunit, partial [Bacteroidetes bacterium]
LIDPKRRKSLVFRPGMTASADIQTKTHTDVLSVPINAVTTRERNSDNAVASNKEKKDDNNDNTMADDSKPASNFSGDLDEVVFVLQKDNTVRKVKVKTGIQDINNIEILDGINVGEEVVTGPYGTVSKTLKDGTRVSVVPKEKLFETKKS